MSAMGRKQTLAIMPQVSRHRDKAADSYAGARLAAEAWCEAERAVRIGVGECVGRAVPSGQRQRQKVTVTVIVSA